MYRLMIAFFFFALVFGPALSQVQAGGSVHVETRPFTNPGEGAVNSNLGNGSNLGGSSLGGSNVHAGQIHSNLGGNNVQSSNATEPPSNEHDGGHGDNHRDQTSPPTTQPTAEADSSAPSESTTNDSPATLPPTVAPVEPQGDDGLPWGWIAFGVILAIIVVVWLSARSNR